MSQANKKAEAREYDLQFIEGQIGIEPYWRVVKLTKLVKHREERIHVIEYSAYQALQEKLRVAKEALQDYADCGGIVAIEALQKIEASDE